MLEHRFSSPILSAWEHWRLLEVTTNSSIIVGGNIRFILLTDKHVCEISIVFFFFELWYSGFRNTFTECFITTFFRDSMIFAGVNSFTSILAGLVIFSVLGFMAKAQGVSVADVAESGKTYLHITKVKTVKWIKCIERYIFFSLKRNTILQFQLLDVVHFQS